jgi:hypothetical protein
VIVVRVELHSAVTGETRELARMIVDNVGGTKKRGDYRCRTLRGRNPAAFDQRIVQREGQVRNYPRLDLHVWNLVARALAGMGYGGGG